ncbi:MAG: sulfatase, partial [Acidobacteriota bacterium]
MRRIIAAGAVLLAALALVPACSSKPPADASGMNLLVITLDTTRADAVGLYGNKDGVTPRIDELGRTGIVFQECYTPVPLTLPAHCSLFTGRYPLGHGVRNNGTYALPAAVPTLARLFKDKGYETAAVVASFTVAAKFGLAQGFDTYEEDFESGRSILNFLAEIPADRVTAKFESWLGRRTGGKFFAWVHFYDAHSPYVPHGEPVPSGEGAAWQLYEGEVRFVDAHVGKIVQALKDKGLYENTLIVLVGDHGEGFAEHKERGHGIFCYQESLRVPLVLHNPRLFKEPKTVAGRTSLVDVMPSLLELFGVKTPSGVQGRSFWNQAAGKEKGRREIYFESLFGQEEYNWAPLTGLIDGKTKYISLPEPELYDIDADPGEKADLFAARRDEAREIDKKLETFVRRTAAVEKGAGRRELSSADVEKLKSLGYVSSFGSKSSPVMDPKKGIDVYSAVAELKELLKQKDYENAEARLAGVLAKYPAIELPDIY